MAIKAPRTRSDNAAGRITRAPPRERAPAAGTGGDSSPSKTVNIFKIKKSVKILMIPHVLPTLCAPFLNMSQLLSHVKVIMQ